MQIKLLNFYKVLSQFATSLIGSFVALIIFQACNNIGLAFLYIVGTIVLRTLMNICMFKLYQRKPQLVLMLRVFPLLVYTISILLLETHLVLAIILITFFNALSNSFKELPMEIIFNYSSLKSKARSAGITRLFEQLGVILAMIMGGLFLDYLEQYILVILAISIYLIAVIPLVIYYFRGKNSPTFNKEATSNAATGYKNIVIKQKIRKKTANSLLVRYGTIYFLFCGLDALIGMTQLFMFYKGSAAYSYAGFIQAAFYGSFGIGSYIAGMLGEKKDLTVVACVTCFLMAAFVVAVPFVISIIWVLVPLFFCIGFSYSFLSFFCYNQMMQRVRIMGVSNMALFTRTHASLAATSIINGLCSVGAVMIIPAFIVISVMLVCCGSSIPHNEEKTRELLVDFLQNNKMY